MSYTHATCDRCGQIHFHDEASAYVCSCGPVEYWFPDDGETEKDAERTYAQYGEVVLFDDVASDIANRLCENSEEHFAPYMTTAGRRMAVKINGVTTICTVVAHRAVVFTSSH